MPKHAFEQIRQGWLRAIASYLRETCELVPYLHEQYKQQGEDGSSGHDILVFLPGEEDMVEHHIGLAEHFDFDNHISPAASVSPRIYDG